MESTGLWEEGEDVLEDLGREVEKDEEEREEEEDEEEEEEEEGGKEEYS